MHLEDAQKRAELEARTAAAKKRLAIERQRQELEWKMRELELETEHDILTAKKEALLKFEREEGMSESEHPITKGETRRETPSEEEASHAARTKEEPEVQKEVSESTATEVLASLVNVLKDQGKQGRLPMIEPGVFTGSVDKFPIWLRAFETYVEHRTSSTVERLHFLSRYTDGEAHSAIAGFLHLRTADAYIKAKEKLVSRYGNDFLVASSYLNRLREWPIVRSGDSKGLQRLADLLEHCLMASAALPGMRALDDPHTIHLVLKKLPAYVTDRWKRLVDTRVYGATPSYPTFTDFVELVATEARIACGPVSVQMEESLHTRDPKQARGKVHTFTSSTDNPCGACGHKTEERSVSKETTTRSRRPCIICGEDHTVHACKKFMAMSLEDRKVQVLKKRLCRGCLKPGHMWRDCRRRDKCDKCSKAHPTLLHDEALAKTANARGHSETENSKPTRGEMQAKASSLRSTVQNVEDCSTSHCHTMIVPVKLYRQDQPERKVVTYALLDPQSDASFVTDALCDALHPEATEVELELSTMNGRKILKCMSTSGLVVESLENGEKVDLPTLYSRQEIPADHTLIPRPETCLKWTHLHQVADKIPVPQSDADIGLLLGVNCPRIIKPREVIPGEEDDPWAVRTLLGWGIVGLISKSEPKGCFYVGSGDERKKLCHFAYRTRVKDVSLREVQQVFDSGFFDQRQEKAMSQEDIQFVKVMTEGMHKEEGGHFEAPLPLKEGQSMPNNRDLAEARLAQLKRRLLRDDKLRTDYAAFMSDLFLKGYAEPVPDEERDRDGMVNYVPHHGVYHEKKGKLRVVFDCSALCKDDCLNARLLQGPDVNNSLIGILVRFREAPVAFSGDIEGMFNQVRVNPEHRDLLRFLWWSDGDLDEQPREYRMCTHLFGATSSPAVALFALKKTAQMYGEEYSPEAASFVERNFYIDDGVASTKTSEDAVRLIRDAVSLCSKGGFNLHKFISNDRDVLKALPVYSLSKSCQLALDGETPLPLERVLGLKWETEEDSLCIDVSFPSKPATRRGILSSVSAIYDPLGFISPCTLVAKNILKRLCVDKYSWDDTIPEDMEEEWRCWKEDVELLSMLKVPRCFVSEELSEVKKYEVHHFSDASYDGCGQCSYLRTVFKDDRIASSLIMAKSRVTPVRAVTIPRLELVGAVISVQVSCFLRSELSIRDYEEYFWSDSRAVLGYIRNDAKRFHVFVANRIQYIRQHTEPRQWHYIESKNNPADLASRGVGARELFTSNLWWHGPELLTADVNIPDTEQEFIVPNDDSEVKRSSYRTTVLKSCEDDEGRISQEAKRGDTEGDAKGKCEGDATKPNSELDEEQRVVSGEDDDVPPISSGDHSLAKRLGYFSSWHRAKKSVALCRRYMTILASKPSQNRGTTDVRSYVPVERMTVDDLMRAEQAILKSVQKEAFTEELSLLTSQQQEGNYEECGREENAKEKAAKNRITGRDKFIKRKSPIYRLDPFLREDGLICVGGRMKNSTLSKEVAHPVILPRKSHVTELIVKACHENTCHGGRGTTLNELRAAGYWVIGGRRAVSSYILGCVTCKKLRGSPRMQKMADLPLERTEPVEPFSHCAVDCFGPFYVKERRSQVKRWGILFSCLASRAIHLETVCSLSADSFLNAFRRLVCRRGPVRKLFCDNGTNFVGGKNMLEEALKEDDHIRIRGELLKKDCDWFEFKFNVPQASAMGGVWERMIRSVRSVLTPLIVAHGHTMDDELLRTLLVECEAIVNSRPISYFSGASDDTLLPLSPNQILTLKSRVAVPYPGSFSQSDLYVRQRWRRVQFLADQFWRRWRREFLPTLQERQKWVHRYPNLQPGDIVAVIDDDEPRSRWPLGRITSVYPSGDGLVRKVCVRIGSTNYDRPVNRVILLIGDRDDSQSGSKNSQ
ncbi:uncharacterized protein LOC122369489 [Amphibalanus amphitrite]|uniref:uncharacterized protein LOC122369489 n=1 Tax=Amphibalanus amphitrite TaxID=1232801 RepID=UPI001C8FB660|nr:uncharacterized protein LOC122369489 [Amphibalanus amphitrite]